jgi:hypothetical protein
MIAVATDREKWEARRKELRGKNRALLLVLVGLALLFYFISIVRTGALL